MKKVILYGVCHVELRRDIEYFLDDGYEIIGYSDTYYTNDVLDGKRFIPPKKLSNTEFDYILLLSFKQNVLTDMRSSLIDQGVSPNKIIDPTMFLHQGKKTMQVDLIGDIDTQYQDEEGLIFGLSYSLLGIIGKRLRPAFYDCSWLGMDLYYNYRIFQYFRRQELLSNVKIALLVFPYYYFNYDMSKSMYHYQEGQMFALRGLNDWHNYQQIPGASDYVTNYRMFGRKISNFYRFHKFEMINRNIYHGKDREADLGGPWIHDYPDAVVENTALFTSFYNELAETGITPILVIPPFYVKGINQASMEFVNKRKQEFYRIVEAAGINTFDFFDIYLDCRELFANLTHLNSDGAEAFTELINKAVLQERGGKDI